MVTLSQRSTPHCPALPSALAVPTARRLQSGRLLAAATRWRDQRMRETIAGHQRSLSAGPINGSDCCTWRVCLDALPYLSASQYRISRGKTQAFPITRVVKVRCCPEQNSKGRQTPQRTSHRHYVRLGTGCTLLITLLWKGCGPYWVA